MSRGDKRKSKPRAQKTQIFKVLCFEPDFRGMLYMSSMSIKLHNLTKIKPKNLFSHDSSGFHAFPQVLSLVDTSSSKLSQMDSKFWDLVSNPS